MTTLRDRLNALADEAPVALSEPDLWDRGRRYAARRRTRTVLVVGVACLVLVALAGLTWFRSEPPPPPVPVGAPLGLPDHLYQPSRWLPGTDDAGPIGPVVALIISVRGSTFLGSEAGTVAVSATTGEYRFLDLPDLFDAWRAALSPDGRHVAYWYAGTTRLASGEKGNGPGVVGYAVYDTVTGEVVRQSVPSDHGLFVDNLGWVDSQTLVADYAFWVSGWDDPDRGTANGGTVRVWRPGAEPEPVPAPWTPDFGQREDSSPVTFVDGNGALGVLEPGSPLRFRELRLDLDPGQWGHAIIDERGRRAALLSGLDQDAAGGAIDLPSDVLVADLPGGDFRPVPGTDRSFQVLRWIGDEVVVVSWPDGAVGGGVLVRAVDVRTGATRTLVDASGYGVFRVAVDLLTLPSVPGRRPPAQLDPQFVGIGTLVIVALGTWAAVRWRRRVRP